MSVLIKGMEMPKNGDELLSIDIWPSGKVSINLDSMCKEVGTAVEVPTPHGRLIDADLIYQETMRYSERTRKMVMDMVNALPTIIEAEE